MSTPISKELQDQIEREAAEVADDIFPGRLTEEGGDKKLTYIEGYEAGATAYAHYKERCEQLERWKREAMELLNPILDYSKEANIPLGKSIPAVILQRAKRFEQAKKALEEIEKLDHPIDNVGRHNMIMKIKHISAKALASWKEEGKDNQCAMCNNKPKRSGLLVCSDCYKSFDGDRRSLQDPESYH